MKRKSCLPWSPFVLVAAGLLLTAGLVFSQTAPVADGDPPQLTPEELAQRCIAAITQIADQRTQRNARTADKAVALIQQLLEAGDTQNAVLVGHWASDSINLHSDRCLRDIRDRVFRTCRQIVAAGGTRELVLQVQAAGSEQSRRIIVSRMEALAKIQEALPDPEPEPTDGE